MSLQADGALLVLCVCRVQIISSCKGQPDASGCGHIPTRLRSLLECCLGAVGQRVVVALAPGCSQFSRKDEGTR
jgi:hypothetical protein